MEKLRFWKEPVQEDADVLVCPYCTCGYTHQGEIQIFNREQEDSERGLHVAVDEDTVKIDSNMTGNPSSRRQGMVVRFECENCRRDFKVCIEQHKGHTFMYAESEKRIY